jgi:alpha-beta hydrolase superfamily lysophospholipase
MLEDRFKGGGGLNIVYRSWHPEGKPRAVLIIVHGFNSHSGQYRWAANRFTASGYAVYVLDQRGRGKSEGERFYVEQVEDYVNDVATFVALAKSREPGQPVFMLGHGAGGIISCVYTLDHQKEIDGLICESLALKVQVPELLLKTVKWLARYFPRLPVLKLSMKGFSRDAKVVESMVSDPLIAKEIQPAITVAAMLRASERLERDFARIRLPVLILHGAADTVTLPIGSKMFQEYAGSDDKTLKIYPDHAHDLLNDIGKEKVIADIMGWMSPRIRTR